MEIIMATFLSFIAFTAGLFIPLNFLTGIPSSICLIIAGLLSTGLSMAVIAICGQIRLAVKQL